MGDNGVTLQGHVALVTGSSRGIGRAIASRLAQEGASVIVNARSETAESREALAALPAGDGRRHLFIAGDVSAADQAARLIDRIARTYGRLDMLVNNAGSTQLIDHQRLDELTPELFDLMYRVHVRGPYLCIQRALPLLQRSPAALVVNIASIASVTALGSNIAYCAMKAALVNMTKSLARALAPDVRVNAVSPGLTDTGLTEDWAAYRREQVTRTPLGRLATCDDVGSAVMALATSLTYVTGQNLIVDGGRVLT